MLFRSEIGEHSTQVLKDLGLSDAEIEQLIEQGLIDSFSAPQPAE